ncbi:RING-H2 finger protein ATL39-like [Lolium perenne]|uniref:RING-H2 finger protein ATL39-like n=1 Tax=Lolium perenne TaxID=4522 RepID=UPI0021F64636|nr:RING-H2 finger protein ATL39-like [Lolium perenne]
MGRPIPSRFIHPAPPPSYAPTPTPPWHPPPPSSNQGGWFILALVGAFVVGLFYFFVCGTLSRHCEDRDRAEAAAAPPPAAPPPPPQLQPSRHYEELHRLRQATAVNPAARRRLPAFRYDRSVKHNVVDGGEEEPAAACPVCLGAFRLGETVRLLPMCLHLYHVECIDPWLDAHSTCPICRSDTVPRIDDVARR